MDTSPYAYEHVLRTMRSKPASFSKAAAGAMETQSFENRLSLFGPLVWFYHLFMRLTFGIKAGSDRLYVAEDPEPQNRSERLLDRYVNTHAGFPVARRISSLFDLLMAGMTPGQKQELDATLSGLGRIRVYGMRTRRGLARLRYPQMIRDAHGWWRMPITSAVARGHWEVQLPDT